MRIVRGLSLRFCGVLALALGLGVPLWAHDTWLIASRGMVPPGAEVMLDLTSGMAFPTLDYAVKPDRVERAQVRLGGTTAALDRRSAAPHSLRFKARLTSPGIASCWVELKPKTLELTPDKVEEYFEEIGASAEIRRVWRDAGPSRKWKETYVKHAKTFVRVGRPEADASWGEPVGMLLEIVPDADPTAVQAGGELPVRVLKQGQPMAGFTLALQSQGSKTVFAITDGQGKARFRLPRAGRYLLAGTDLRSAGQPGTWDSDFTTLTFETVSSAP